MLQHIFVCATFRKLCSPEVQKLEIFALSQFNGVSPARLLSLLYRDVTSEWSRGRDVGPPRVLTATP